MSTNRASTMNGPSTDTSKSYYEQQRELLITEIAQSLELVLQNINKLNRSLEEVTQVGAEFAPVESLWSHFENVMAKDPAEGQDGNGGAGASGGGEGATQTELEDDETEV